MGTFEPERDLYRLKFADGKYAGLEVTTAAITTGELLEFIDLADAAEDASNLQAAKVLLKRFGDVLEEWNVTRKGEPVPPTYEGLLMQQLPFTMDLIMAWITEMTAAPPPLPGGSPSGGSSPEVPPAVVSGSQSLPSSPAPS
jgi:hypothetical protein